MIFLGGSAREVEVALVLSMSDISKRTWKYGFCLQPHFCFLSAVTYASASTARRWLRSTEKAVEGADFPLELIF